MCQLEMLIVPQEIFDKEEFLTLAEKASKCIIKKNLEQTKLKLRTNRYLYTIKLDTDEANDLLGKIGCPVEEV